MKKWIKSIVAIIPLVLSSCSGLGQDLSSSSPIPEMDLTEAECFQLLSDDAFNIASPYQSGTLIVDNSVKENDSLAQDHTVVTLDAERKIGSLYATYNGGARLTDCFCKIVSQNGQYVEYSNSPYYPYHSSFVDENYYRHLITLYSSMRMNMSDYDTYSDFINGIGFLIYSDNIEEFIENTKESFIANFYYSSSVLPSEQDIRVNYTFGRQSETAYTFNYSILYRSESYTAALKLDVVFESGHICNYAFQFGTSTHFAGAFSDSKKIIASSFTTYPYFSEEDYDAVKVDGFFAPTKNTERDLTVYLDGSTTYQDDEGNTKTFCKVSSVRYGTNLFDEVIPSMLPVMEQEVKDNCTLDTDIFFDSAQNMKVVEDYVMTSWRDVSLYFRSKPNPGYCAVLVNYYNYAVTSFEPLSFSNNNLIMRSDMHVLSLSKQKTYVIDQYNSAYSNSQISIKGVECSDTINLVDGGYIVVDVVVVPKKYSSLR